MTFPAQIEGPLSLGFLRKRRAAPSVLHMCFNQHKQQFVGQKTAWTPQEEPIAFNCLGGGLELLMMLGIDFTRSNVRRFGKGW